MNITLRNTCMWVPLVGLSIVLRRSMLAIISLTCSLGMAHGSQPDYPMAYRMDYLTQSYLVRGDGKLHFVSVDVEWPSWVNSSRPGALATHLSQTLFGVDAMTLQEGIDAYLTGLGTPVNNVPDDDTAREYHLIELKAIDYSPAKYISFRTITTRRLSDSPEPYEYRHHIFTYDLVNDKVLATNDILRKACFPDHLEHEDFIYTLLVNSPDIDARYDTYGVIDKLPGEVCLLRDGLVSDLGVKDADDSYNILTYLPRETADGFLTKNIRKWLDSAPSPRAIEPVNAVAADRSQPVDTTLVYDVVDEKPVFMYGKADLIDFMSQNLNRPPLEEVLDITGRTVVRFVVERDGSVSSPAVVSPASPGFDREAIRVVRLFPRWQPALIDGVAVRASVTLPIKWMSEKY